jgi:predicted nuclease of predicted toxin-antitoxin system
MKLLANENVPDHLVRTLEQRGHDVKWIREAAPGATDGTVLDMAQRENRIVLTLDKDFGALAFRAKLPASSGIILLRLSAASPESLTEIALRCIESRSDWAGYFSVVTPDRIRMTAITRRS